MASVPAASDDRHDSVPCNRRGPIKNRPLDADTITLRCHCNTASRPSSLYVTILGETPSNFYQDRFKARDILFYFIPILFISNTEYLSLSSVVFVLYYFALIESIPGTNQPPRYSCLQEWVFYCFFPEHRHPSTSFSELFHVHKFIPNINRAFGSYL